MNETLLKCIGGIAGYWTCRDSGGRCSASSRVLLKTIVKPNDLHVSFVPAGFRANQ